MGLIHRDCGSLAEFIFHAVQTVPKCAVCHDRESKHTKFQSWDPEDAVAHTKSSPEEWLLKHFDGPIERKAALSPSSKHGGTKRRKVLDVSRLILE